jgi:hypothetical protein
MNFICVASSWFFVLPKFMMHGHMTHQITMDLQEVGCWGMDWIGLAQDRDVASTCECGNEF